MFPKFGNKVIAALAVAAGLALSASAMAANTQSAPQNGASSSAAAPQVSQREMKKFADINVKAAEIRSQYSGQLKSAKDPKKVTALHKKMNQEILLALRNEGLSVKQYGQVLRAVQQNPQVKKQVIQMMRNEQAGSKG